MEGLAGLSAYYYFPAERCACSTYIYNVNTRLIHRDLNFVIATHPAAGYLLTQYIKNLHRAWFAWLRTPDNYAFSG